jgi:hypothetical protein
VAFRSRQPTPRALLNTPPTPSKTAATAPPDTNPCPPYASKSNTAGIDGRGTITLASGPTYTMHADWFNA